MDQFANSAFDQFMGGQADPSVLMEVVMERFRESRKEKDRVKCPVCNRVHRPLTEGQKAVCKHISHNALEIFVAAPCPICLEDVVQPPNIALPCGHVVCPEDFKQIGGQITARSANNEDEDYGEEVETEEEFRDAFMEHLRETGIMQGADGDLFGRPRPFEMGNGNGALDLDDDLDDDDLDDEVDSRASMPPLEADTDDDGSDQSMPELINRRGQAADSSDEDDMPDLVNRQDDNSSSDGSVPPLMGRGGFDEDSSDDDSMPNLLQRNREDDDSSDDSMPVAAQRADDSDSDDSSIPPALGPRGGARSSGAAPYAGDIRADFELGISGGVYLLKENGTVVEWTNGYDSVTDLDFEPSHRPVPCSSGYIEVADDCLVTCYTPAGDGGFDYRIDRNAQIVSDGDEGIWTLYSQGEEKILKYYDEEFHDGKNVRRVSEQSTLVPGYADSVWVHVKRDSRSIEAGLWFFKTRGQKQLRTGEEISVDAKVVPDGDGSVWVMESRHGSTFISHVTRTDRRPYRNSPAACDFTRDSKLITCSSANGVYVHTRENDRWALFFYKDGMLHLCQTCPKAAKIVADGNGNAWVMQKDGNERVLCRVHGPSNSVQEFRLRHPAGTVMLGAY